MSDDPSPVDRLLPPAGDPGAARERWYERLLHRLHLKSRESIRDDLEDALADTEEDPDFSPKERTMLKNVLGLHRIRVDDVMVPRADIIAVASDTSLGELLGVFRTAGHSRLPVYGETLDDPKGMVHIRDFVEFVAARAEGANAGTPEVRREVDGTPSLGGVDLSVTLATAKILRPVLYAPPSMPAIDLLVRMQATRTHIALVIDEYGGTDGLVSIEDLVEIVVGDIEDEHDDAVARMIVSADDKTFIADGRASLEEVSETLGIDLAGDDMAEEIDTLGGLIGTLAGRVPSRGELVAGPNGLEFEVLDADPRRLKRVRIHRRETPLEGASPDETGTRAAAAAARRSGADGSPA
ncbi:MAG TPA: hemolysin family protein [Beijerinckiaceae bacterium]|nr:hemolysin family protein [Beijerinckiaceae bacterium]